MSSSPGGRHPQEDRAGCFERGAWIVDGATGVGPALGLPGPSDAAWYAQTLSHGLACYAASATNTREWLGRAIDDVDGSARRLGINTSIDFPSAAVALALETSGGELETLHLADCVIIVESENGLVQVLDDPRWQDAEAEVKHLLAQSAENDRERVLLDRRRTRNTPQGRWVARRERTAIEHALVQHPTRSPRRILLASDGAGRILGSPPYDKKPVGVLDLVERSVDEAFTFLRDYENEFDESQLPWISRHDDATFLLMVMS